MAGTAPITGLEPGEAEAHDAVPRDRWVQVRVDLHQPGDAWAPPDAAQAAIEADNLEQAVQDLLFALPAGSYDSVQREAGASSLTLRVDAAGLDELLASPLVASVAAPDNPDMRWIAAGDEHSLAIEPNGSPGARGANSGRQTGASVTTGHPSPVPVSGSGIAGPQPSIILGSDYAVTNVVLTPINPQPSGTFSATVTVRNLYSGSAEYITIQVWANQPNPQGCGAVGDQAILMYVPSDSSRTVTLTGLPAGTAGAKTLRVFADSECIVSEPSEANNHYTKAYTVATSAIDFVVTSVVLTPSGPIADGTFSAAVTVKNQGTVAGTPGTLQVWSNQPSVQACGAVGNQSVVLTSLAAGASRTVTLSNLPAGAPGAKTLRTFVDSKCQTAESNETNNQFTKAYTVQGPDFVVTNIVLTPSSPTSNGTFSATVTVKNQGTLSGNGGYLDIWTNQSTAQTCPADGNAYASVGTLAAGASQTLTVTGLRSRAAGTKTLRAFVDSYCQTTESNDGNNQRAKVYTVAP